MATKTSYLELTMPENGEYVDSWDKPLNANMETIDDHMKNLRDDLVGSTGSTSTLGTPDLDTRLNAAMDATGKLKLDSSESFTDLQDSKVYARSGSSSASERVSDRFENVENEVVGSRCGTHVDRYGNSEPSAESGIAQLGAMYGNRSDAIQSPVNGASPNCVIDGPSEAPVPHSPLHVMATAPSEIIINGGSIPVVYNIDGHIFRADGEYTLDISASGSGPLAAGTYHLWVSRMSSDYGSGGVAKLKKYAGQNLGGSFKLETRIIPTHASHRADSPSWAGPGSAYSLDPVNGQVTSGLSKFESATAEFNSYGVKGGDILVVTSPSSVAGEYVIDSVVSNTELHTTVDFHVTVSGINFHVERRTMPAFGYDGPSTHPSYSPGKVFIGTFAVDGSGHITDLKSHAFGGLYDTGWMDLATAFSFGISRNHFLGVQPSTVDVMLRRSNDPSAVVIFNPTTKIDVQHADSAGGTAWGVYTLTVPAITVTANNDTYTVDLTNPLISLSKAFFDNGAYKSSTEAGYQIRIIARR